MIKASEINQYIFCPRAWWWREIEELEPEDTTRLVEGEQFHRRYTEYTLFLERLRAWAWVLIAVAICLMAIELAMTLGG